MTTMKLKRFKIPIYDYSVTFVEFEGEEDANKFEKVFKSLKISQEDINNTRKCLLNKGMNGGDTYRNENGKFFLVVIFPCENERMRRNVIAHESRHVADRLLDWANIHDMEASAFIQGYLAEYMY
jgi:hypothetical protein